MGNKKPKIFHWYDVVLIFVLRAIVTAIVGMLDWVNTSPHPQIVSYYRQSKD